MEFQFFVRLSNKRRLFRWPRFQVFMRALRTYLVRILFRGYPVSRLSCEHHEPNLRAWFMFKHNKIRLSIAAVCPSRPWKSCSLTCSDIWGHCCFRFSSNHLGRGLLLVQINEFLLISFLSEQSVYDKWRGQVCSSLCLINRNSLWIFLKIYLVWPHQYKVLQYIRPKRRKNY